MARTIALTVGGLTATAVLAVGLIIAGYGPGADPRQAQAMTETTSMPLDDGTLGPALLDHPTLFAPELMAGSEPLVDLSRVVLIGPDGSAVELLVPQAGLADPASLVRLAQEQYGSIAAVQETKQGPRSNTMQRQAQQVQMYEGYDDDDDEYEEEDDD